MEFEGSMVPVQSFTRHLVHGTRVPISVSSSACMRIAICERVGLDLDVLQARPCHTFLSSKNCGAQVCMEVHEHDQQYLAPQ